MFTLTVDSDLTLKQLEMSDAQELFELSDQSRSHLETWLPWIHQTNRIQDTESYLTFCLERYEQNNGLTVGIFHKETLTGVIDLHVIDYTNKLTSIGYWMSELHKGRGLMTRSCKALFTYVFEEMGLNRIEIRAAEENVKSRAVPERLGFKQEGVLQEAAMLYGKPVNHVVYGMTAKGWQNK